MTATETLFFYGTLRHRPLLELVLGPAGAARIRLSPAHLPGHAARWVAGECYPMIRPDGAAVAEGLLAEGLLPEDVDRLEYYEGGFLYGLTRLSVHGPDGPRIARVFYPEDGGFADGGPFSLSDWEARWGAITMHAARDYMAGYGRFPAGEMARTFPRSRARAWSRVLAEATPAPAAVRTGPGRDSVVVRRNRRRHEGFFALDQVTVDHPTFAGGQVTVTREVFVGSDAAMVLPYDPATDRVALVEQFRAGPLLRGDPRPWMLEPVAGLIDPGETPEACARREAEEEAGLTLRRLVPVPGGYPSPGATTEHYHLFVGLCDLDPGHLGPGGVEAEGEDIRTHIVTLDAAMALAESGEAPVIPLTTLLLWTALNRARLRDLA